VKRTAARSPRPRSPSRAAPRKTEARAVSAELPLVRVDVEAGPARHWIRDVTERWDLRVRFDVCRPMGRDYSQLLQVVELSGDPGDLGAAERFLRHHPEIRQITVIGLSPSRRFVRAVTAMPSSCREIITGGAVCAGCQFLPGGGTGARDRWSLVIPRSPVALRGLARLRARGPDAPAPILGMHRFVPERTLTPRQATALETAHRLGFYNFPRRTNLHEIARILGVSRSTAAELLRRAESKMLAARLGGS
jgi:hypothetical protein